MATRRTARRERGTGSVYQRGDGQWVAALNTTEHGQRKRRVAYASSRQEALEKLRELQRQQEQGVNVFTPQQTVEQFLRHWLEEVVRPSRAEATYTTYRRVVTRHIIPVIISYGVATGVMTHSIHTHDTR